MQLRRERLLALLVLVCWMTVDVRCQTITQSPTFNDGSSLNTINLNSAFPQTIHDVTLTPATATCATTDSNPTGTYSCSILSTNPSTAVNYLGVSALVYASTVSVSTTICTIYMYSQMTTSDYIPSGSNGNFQILLQIQGTCNDTTNRYTFSTSGYYLVTVTPASTTTSTTTSTSTSTSTSTTTTTSTSTTTKTSTSTTTTVTPVVNLAGSNPTASNSASSFASSAAGIAVITIASVAGAALLAVVLYYSITACITAGHTVPPVTAPPPTTSAPPAVKAAEVPAKSTPPSNPSPNNQPTYNYQNAKSQNWSGTPQPFMNSNTSYFGQAASSTIAPLGY